MIMAKIITSNWLCDWVKHIEFASLNVAFMQKAQLFVTSSQTLGKMKKLWFFFSGLLVMELSS